MLNEQARIEEVAFLRSRGKKISVIAETLQLPLATVDQLLKKAEGQGLYREIIHFDYEKVSPERIKQLRRLDHVEHLRDRLRAVGVDPHNRSKQIFQQIHVFDSGGVDDTPRGLDVRLTRFGFEAAPTLAECLFYAHEVGIAWGRTLSLVIRSLQSQRVIEIRGRKYIRFVPTCGEPYGTSARADSSSFLVAELDERINEDDRKRLSLTGIPVVLPKTFAESGQDKVIRDFLQYCPAYRAIFGPMERETALWSISWTLSSPVWAPPNRIGACVVSNFARLAAFSVPSSRKSLWGTWVACFFPVRSGPSRKTSGRSKKSRRFGRESPSITTGTLHSKETATAA